MARLTSYNKCRYFYFSAGSICLYFGHYINSLLIKPQKFQLCVCCFLQSRRSFRIKSFVLCLPCVPPCCQRGPLYNATLWNLEVGISITETFFLNIDVVSVCSALLLQQVTNPSSVQISEGAGELFLEVFLCPGLDLSHLDHSNWEQHWQSEKRIRPEDANLHFQLQSKAWMYSSRQMLIRFWSLKM